MSFFDFQSGKSDSQDEWKVSDKFWVYFAFAIPLTCLTLAVWFWGQRLRLSRAKSSSSSRTEV